MRKRFLLIVSSIVCVFMAGYLIGGSRTSSVDRNTSRSYSSLRSVTATPTINSSLLFTNSKTNKPTATLKKTNTPKPKATKKPAGKQYVLNTNTKKFHIPSCSSVKQMKDKNKKYVTMSRDEIIAQGYDPCGRCHP